MTQYFTQIDEQSLKDNLYNFIVSNLSEDEYNYE